MKVTLLCSDAAHPVNLWLLRWMERNREKHEIVLARKVAEIPGGDILFLVSCSELVSQQHRKKYKKTLILHASDLPRGRGWSPHIWQIIEGESELTLCVLEAQDKIDSGNIVRKEKFTVRKTDLFDEINYSLFSCELDMIDYSVNNFENLPSIPQSAEINPTYFRRREPGDSELDPNRTIKEQFDLIRVCDPDRYPAHFYLHGQKYKLTLEKIDD